MGERYGKRRAVGGDAMGLRWLTNLLLLGWMDIGRCLYSIVYIPSLG